MGGVDKKSFKAKWFLYRALLLILITKFFSAILRTEIPPIISVSAIIRDKKKILLIDLSYNNSFGIPGGVIKGGENAEQALKREVTEETGLKVKSYKYLGSTESRYKGIGTLSLVFEVETTGIIENSSEGKPVWIDISKLDSLNLYSSVRETLKRHL